MGKPHNRVYFIYKLADYYVDSYNPLYKVIVAGYADPQPYASAKAPIFYLNVAYKNVAKANLDLLYLIRQLNQMGINVYS